MRTTDTARPAALRRAVVLGATAGALALLTAACGSGGSSGSGSGSAPAPAPAATSQAAAGQGTQVKVTLTEFHVALSDKTLAPGVYTFVVTNSGSTTHALSIDGPSLSDKATADLSAGQSADLTVTLQPGSYDFYCPVDHHKQMGMSTTVTVAAGGGSEGGGVSPLPTATATTAAGGGGGGGY